MEKLNSLRSGGRKTVSAQGEEDKEALLPEHTRYRASSSKRSYLKVQAKNGSEASNGRNPERRISFGIGGAGNISMLADVKDFYVSDS